MFKSVVTVLALLGATATAVKIPTHLKLKRCDYSEPQKFDECLKAAVEDAIPKLKDGSSELGIPPLEPVEVTEISVETDRNSPISLNLKLKNLKIWGVPTGLTLQSLRWDEKNRFLAINSTNEKIVMEGDYESTGRLLAIPIAGKGPIRIELTDIITETTMAFKPVTRKGAKYWELTKMNYDVIEVGNNKMHLEGIIKGNKALDQSLNQVLNDNWRELDRQVRPGFSRALHLYFSGITQRFFRRVPINDLIPGIEKN